MDILKLIGLKKTAKIPEREVLAPQESRMVRLGLIVGHDNKEGGAALVGTQLNEYLYNTDVAWKAQEYAKEHEHLLGIDVVVITRDKIGISGAYKKATDLDCDFVIELHFNAANKTARGTETLCSADRDSRDFAKAVHAACLAAFRKDGMHDRGVKVLSKSDRGGRNVYAFKGPSCLVEPFFGDNPNESILATVFQYQYAKHLVRAVEKYARNIGLLPTK